MNIHILKRNLVVPVPRDRVFEFFSDAHNLERITPPWLRFQVTTPGPIAMREGALIDYRLRVRGLPMDWRTRIALWNPPFQFVDTQLKGPYKLWHHTHTFEECDGGTLMTDEIRYRLPLGPLGRAAHALMVRRDVESIFDYRNRTIARLLDLSSKVKVA